MDGLKGLLFRCCLLLFICLCSLLDPQDSADPSLVLSVFRRLWVDGGVFASSDIVTFGRDILAGGLRLGLGMRAFDGYSASAHPLYTLVDSISLSIPFWRIDSIATCCCAFVSIITLLVPSPSFIFMMRMGMS